MWTLEIQRAESPLLSTSLQVRIEWKQTEWPWRVDVNCISLAKRKSNSLCWEITRCVCTSKLSILLQLLGLRLCCSGNSWNVKSNHANQQLHWFHKKLAALCCNSTYFITFSFHSRRVRVDLLSYRCSFFEKKRAIQYLEAWLIG